MPAMQSVFLKLKNIKITEREQPYTWRKTYWHYAHYNFGMRIICCVFSALLKQFHFYSIKLLRTRFFLGQISFSFVSLFERNKTYVSIINRNVFRSGLVMTLANQNKILCMSILTCYFIINMISIYYFFCFHKADITV